MKYDGVNHPFLLKYIIITNNILMIKISEKCINIIILYYVYTLITGINFRVPTRQLSNYTLFMIPFSVAND